MHRPAVIFALVGNLLISCGTFLVAKYALSEIAPLHLAFLRFLLASGFLYAIYRFIKGQKLARSDRWKILFLGFIAIPINQGFFLWGLSHSTPTHSALFYSTTPAFVLLFALFLAQEKATPRKISGIGLAVAGVVIVLFERGLHFDRRYLFGDFLLLIATMAWALYTVLGKSYLQRYGAISLTTFAMLAGTLLFSPLGLYGIFSFDYHSVTLKGWLSLFYLSFVTSVVAYSLWYYALARIEATKVAVVNNFQPVITALFSAWLFGEQFSTHFILGGLVVLAGIFVVELA